MKAMKFFKLVLTLSFTTLLTFGCINGVLFETPEAVAQTPLEKGVFDTADLVKNVGEDFGSFYESYLPSIINYTAKQIKMEEGKSIDQFFVIKKCLNPCLKSPSTCYEKMDDYYHESIFKLISAIVQINDMYMNLKRKGKAVADDELVDYVSKRALVITAMAGRLYMLAGQNNNLPAGGSVDFQAEFGDGTKFGNTTNNFIVLSPVGRAILNSELDFKSKQRLIGIWMLRQVPYAVKDIMNEDINMLKQQLGFVYTPASKETIDNQAILFLNGFITYGTKPANIDWKKYLQKKR